MDFGCKEVGGVFSEVIKKGGFVPKIFILIMVNEVLKTCKKSYLLTYIKVKLKQQETKGLAVSCKFL